MSRLLDRAVLLHLALLAGLFALQFVSPDYVQLRLTRVMILSVYALGYAILFGYTGLLSLGHAMFFATGLYTAALGVTQFGLAAPAAFGAAIVAGIVFSGVVGAVALRTTGVAFMIVTLMFAQAFYLATLYFGEWTRGDEGIVLPPESRTFEAFGATVDLADLATRYNLAFALFAIVMLGVLALVRSPFGRVLVAIRENEARTVMLGYDVVRQKWIALVVSGTLSAVAGAAYALSFAYAGSTLASIQQSINPLLWTLVGGASTVIGPFLGTLIMFTLVDVASGYTTASLLAVGVVLIALVLFFPRGIMGWVRKGVAPWLP
jgi:branched-chain amino acid transport system permease protein